MDADGGGAESREAGAKAKSSKTARGVRNPKAVEIDLMRDEMRTGLIGLAPPTCTFCLQLFLPQRAHVFYPNLFTAGSLVLCAIFSAWALRACYKASHAKTTQMHVMVDISHHAVRVLSSLVWITLDKKDLFALLAFVFLAPCDAARTSRHMTFVVYLAIHMLMIFYRFAGSLLDDMSELPFFIASLACSHILYETSVMKRRTEESALEKSRALVTIAEDIVNDMFECFCDATARVTTTGLTFTDYSPSLSTLLSRRISVGRSFMDCVHPGDRDEYQNTIDTHLKPRRKASEETDREAVPPDKDISSDSEISSNVMKGLRLMGTDLHLVDSMTIPFEVHVFHACLESLDGERVYKIGIIEREAYKHNTKKKDRRGTGQSSSQRSNRRANQTNLNIESGKIVSSRPAFEIRDVELMRDLHLRQMCPGRAAAEPEAGSPRAPQERSSRSRGSSLDRSSALGGRVDSPRTEEGESRLPEGAGTGTSVAARGVESRSARLREQHLRQDAFD